MQGDGFINLMGKHFHNIYVYPIIILYILNILKFCLSIILNKAEKKKWSSELNL